MPRAGVPNEASSPGGAKTRCAGSATEDCCRLGDLDSWPRPWGEILVDVEGRVMPLMPGGGGSEELCCDIGIGAKVLACSNVPLPMPDVPQTLPFGAVVGHGVNVSLL